MAMFEAGFMAESYETVPGKLPSVKRRLTKGEDRVGCVGRDMNDAALKGIRATATDHAMGAAYDATRRTITKTQEGYEARIGGKLVGVTDTRAGALELLEVL